MPLGTAGGVSHGDDNRGVTGRPGQPVARFPSGHWAHGQARSRAATTRIAPGTGPFGEVTAYLARGPGSMIRTRTRPPRGGSEERTPEPR